MLERAPLPSLPDERSAACATVSLRYSALCSPSSPPCHPRSPTLHQPDSRQEREGTVTPDHWHRHRGNVRQPRRGCSSRDQPWRRTTSTAGLKDEREEEVLGPRGSSSVEKDDWRRAGTLGWERGAGRGAPRGGAGDADPGLARLLSLLMVLPVGWGQSPPKPQGTGRPPWAGHSVRKGEQWVWKGHRETAAQILENDSARKDQ